MLDDEDLRKIVQAVRAVLSTAMIPQPDGADSATSDDVAS